MIRNEYICISHLKRGETIPKEALSFNEEQGREFGIKRLAFEVLYDFQSGGVTYLTIQGSYAGTVKQSVSLYFNVYNAYQELIGFTRLYSLPFGPKRNFKFKETVLIPDDEYISTIVCIPGASNYYTIRI